jgi:hypothetical protein
MTSTNLFTRPTDRLDIDELPLRDVEVPGEGVVQVRDDDYLADLINGYAVSLATAAERPFVGFEVAFPGDVDADSYDAYFAYVDLEAGAVLRLQTYESYSGIEELLRADFPELLAQAGLEEAAA